MNWIQDAGHGGSDPGAVSHGNTEKVYTLEAALYVDKRLADHGIDSDLTRSRDVTLGPNQRTKIVSNYKKCISHHFNAGGGSGAEAIHSIYSDGKFERMLIEEFKKAGYPVRPRSVFFRKNSSGGDYYYMNRETGNCRTTILEYDFVDGPQADKIKDKAYREGMYECVVRAICRDEGVTYRPPVVTKPLVVEYFNLFVDGALIGKYTAYNALKFAGEYLDKGAKEITMVIEGVAKAFDEKPKTQVSNLYLLYVDGKLIGRYTPYNALKFAGEHLDKGTKEITMVIEGVAEAYEEKPKPQVSNLYLLYVDGKLIGRYTAYNALKFVGEHLDKGAKEITIVRE
nr:N-acetylmuramoyl-L-alanine amidase [Fredinandcohnia onubensis]